MDLHLKKDQIVKIGKDEYQVLKTLEEVDRVDVKNKKFIGEHTEVELHKNGSKSLHATHLLKLYYNDKKQGILFEVVSLSKKKIPIDEIEILSG